MRLPRPLRSLAMTEKVPYNTTMTHLYLIRHAATGIPENQQSDELPLSPLGNLQAVKVAQRIMHQTYFVHYVYTSTLKRALETAQVIARTCDTTIQEDSRLDEVEDIAMFAKNLNEEELAVTLVNRARHRAVGFLKSTAQKHHDEDLVIVSHGNIIKAMIAEVCDKPAQEVAAIAIGNTAVTVLSYDQHRDQFTLVLLNDTMHLK